MFIRLNSDYAYTIWKLIFWNILSTTKECTIFKKLSIDVARKIIIILENNLLIAKELFVANENLQHQSVCYFTFVLID